MTGEFSPAAVVGLHAFARDAWPRASLDYLDDRSAADLVGRVVAGPGLVLYLSQLDAVIAPDWIFWMFVSYGVPVAAVSVIGVGAVTRVRRT